MAIELVEIFYYISQKFMQITTPFEFVPDLKAVIQKHYRSIITFQYSRETGQLNFPTPRGKALLKISQLISRKFRNKNILITNI